ncbi:hypothetical protein [Legionella israelensis]|uniref:Uncharacterized protein n=1 Tax=Legionella israelensis TaxID=454 RepID=A0A0W0VQP2_9GAMM|nr:hypothetical protein [Legionella israelensis]KTD22487.1 hypothetical protein Lisr_1508 [Legionella israelensis]QBS09552.1 hypothetical protein E4T55_06590 [Legionella israelensis]SCY17314.1 hypothetical protein SAMN02746069_01526 [Legionella israelensis DSM 19235]STX60472.1 Uncharacterised protein [Legionella israelensis]
MTGYAVLSDTAFKDTLESQLPAENVDKDIPLHGGGDFDHPFNSFSCYKKGNTIVVLHPFDSNRYKDLMTSLQTQYGNLDNCHILAGIKGDGVTEGHIVTAYQPPISEGGLQIFDPKTSDPDKFFHKPSGSRIGTVILSLFRSLIPRYSAKVTINTTNETDPDPTDQVEADYMALGTQSFFDPVSCGYHTASNILTLRQMINDGRAGEINRDNLLKESHNPVYRSANALKNTTHATRVDSGLGAFLKKAWQDTYMPLENEEKRKKRHFGHYFMGWPKEKGAGQKVLYFATLGFLFNPLINLIKLPTEFLLNALSETASYAKNALLATAPTHPALQYLRSTALLALYGLQGAFKGLSLLVRTVTSPITSFKAAWRVHPALGVLSAVVSVAAYAALAIFAAPALLALAGPGAAGFLAPAIKALSYPVTFIAAKLSLEVPAVIGAAFTAIAGSSLLVGIKAGIGKAISFFSNKTAESKQPKITSDIEDFEPIDSEIGQMPEVSPSLSRLNSSSDLTVKGFEENFGQSPVQTSKSVPISVPIKKKKDIEEDFVNIDSPSSSF